jgi:hypothetical protein
VAGSAAATVGTETLEKWTGEIELPGFVEGFQDSMGVGKRKEIREKRWGAVLGCHNCYGTQQERTQYTRVKFQHGGPPGYVARAECKMLADFNLAVNL